MKKTCAFICFSLILVLYQPRLVLQVNSIPVVPEGHDFASLVLRDSWDMSQFSDISQYLNQSGQANLLTNVAVQNGVFSAQSTSLKQATFFLLFPGYKNALSIGKVGHYYPIDAAKYKCIYVAAKVDTGPAQNGVPDQMVVYWFSDENLNAPGGVWGATIPGIVLYPEAGIGTPTPRWKLYSMQLDQAAVPAGYTKWQNAPGGKWRGLRIDATLQQTTFQIDWVRLTDCAGVPISINWAGSGPVSVSIQPEGTSREILMISSTSAKPISLDTQGLEPGNYTYYVRNGGGQTLASSSFQVNQTPIAEFLSPSPTSGEDYATSIGNSWDMNNQSNVTLAECLTYSINNGFLFLDTPSVESQPELRCRPGGGYDPVFYLNTSVPIDTNQNRYLSFRMYVEGPWQNVPGGMIARWVWQIQGTSGNPGARCILASYGIPYDVGWHTYSIDLWDTINGLTEAHAGECRAGPLTWLNSSPALEIRFDPNENEMGANLHQEIDWIKLTKMDNVTHGGIYAIMLSMNSLWSTITHYTFYYTTDLQNPTQHLLQLVVPNPPANFKIFLPLITTNGAINNGNNEQTFNWDTTNVSPGQYYICVKLGDIYNEAVYCSEAQVQIQ
jgi:hypothetical protein